MSEHLKLDEVRNWVLTFFSDVKQGVKTGWNKVYSEYQEKYANAATEVQPKEEPGKEDSETVLQHEEQAATKKSKK